MIETRTKYGTARTDYTEAELASLLSWQREALQKVVKAQKEVDSIHAEIVEFNTRINAEIANEKAAQEHFKRDCPPISPVDAIKAAIAAQRRATFGRLLDK